MDYKEVIPSIRRENNFKIKWHIWRYALFWHCTGRLFGKILHW